MSEPRAVTRELGRFIAESRFDALPQAVRNEGQRAFVNWIGCVFGGCRTEGIERALPLLDEFSGKREATAIGRGKKLDIFKAAFVNSMSNASRSYNDTHLRTVAHPTASVAAALLALAEQRLRVSGADFLHALILGIEVQCRVGNILMTPPARAHFSLSMIGLAGGIGAAAASAKLLGLNEQRCMYAIGLAAAQAGGIRATHGSMGGRMLSGEAARAGLMSAMLAARDFTASDQIFEGSKGYASAYAENADPATALAGLGVDYEILSNTYKPYPCGIVIHPIIDLCLDLARAHDIKPDQVESVQLAVNETAMTLTGRKDPTDSNKAGTSLYHWTAATLIHRAGGLAQGADECVRDPRVIALRGRVAATVDPAIGPDAARGEIRLKDGRVFKGAVDHARGSVDRPMTDDELSEKFLGQAQLIMTPDVARDLLARSWGVIDAGDVAAQLEPLFHV